VNAGDLLGQAEVLIYKLHRGNGAKRANIFQVEGRGHILNDVVMALVVL
jgi:hypothetical protein